MSDFKPMAKPAGPLGDRFGGFVAAYNAQAQKLHEFKLELLNHLKPYRDGRENAWQAIVLTALRYSGHDAVAERGSSLLYDRIQKFATFLQKESDKRPLGEFSDYRVPELLLLASDIVYSRPRPRHGHTQSPVPVDFIYELAFHYRRCTGKKPGAGKGSFAKFIWELWQKMGHEREYDTVVADIKKARKARAAAFNGNADEG